MPEEEVGLRLDLKNRRETAAGIGQVDSQLGRVQRRSSMLNRGFAALGRTGRTVFKGLAVGIAAAGFAAFRLGKAAISEAREAQKVGRTTAAILKATRGAANLTRTAYDTLVKSLMRKNAIDDEQIATAGNLLLTFKKVRREGKGVNDIFGRALATSLDLSAAGFGSNESAAKMLGKALNDPLKGVTALSRAGVTFTAGQQETIKSLIEHNDLLGAQKLILKEVQSQVGGTAAAQVTSAQKLDVAWGNVKEEIGFALIPVMRDLSRFMLREGIPVVRRFAGWLRNEGVPGARDLADRLRPLAGELLPAVATAFGDIRDFARRALPVVKRVIGAFNDMPDWAQKLVVGGGLAALAAGKLKGSKSGGLLSGLVSSGKPVPVFVTNPGFGGAGGKTPSVLGGLKWVVGPAIAYTVAHELQESFPKIFDLRNVDWLPKTSWLPFRGDKGWTDLFGGDDSKVGKPSPGFAQSPKTQALAARDMAHLFAEGTKFEGLLKRIPDRVETKFFTPGLVKNSEDVRALVTRLDLDLDKRQVKTLIKLLGVSEANSQLSALGAHMNAIEGRILEVKLNAQSVAAPTGEKREFGGPVYAGRPYIVGERRPEVFVPDQDGTILPRVDVGGGVDGDWDEFEKGLGTRSERPVRLVMRDGRVIADVVFDEAGRRLDHA